MGMGMRAQTSLRQSTRQTQTLSLVQKLTISNRLFQRHEDLVNALRGEFFRPKATCPKCTHQLSNIEIVTGFSTDPTDYETTCPKTDCRARFRAHLRSGDSVVSSAEIWMYCPVQTQDQMKHREVFTPEQWKKQFPAVYFSALYHFGSLVKAYEGIEIKYKFVEVDAWEEKVVPFLGTMTDKAIADCCEVSVYRVRKLRENLGINAFNQRDILDAEYIF